jgi:protocatechuate 3,4-dioxygenase alpha subunit
MDPLDIRRTRPAVSNVETPLRETGSQTAGPFVHIGCFPNMLGIDGIYPEDLRSTVDVSGGQAIRIFGQIFEGNRIPCKDVMLETWQADRHGDFSRGIWQRAPTDLETGAFVFETIKPGAITQESGGTLAPSINVLVVARGINIGLHTRLYFPEDTALQAGDPHLALVPESRRSTLMATTAGNAGEYRFDIHLQGEAETVFFDI